MFKKLLIASAILATSSTLAFANASPYVGVSLGVKTNTNSDSFRGVPLTIFGGYGTTVNQNIYLGGEVFATLATATLDSGLLRTSYGYGASFIPGILFSDHTFGFARLGVEVSRFPQLNSTKTGGEFGLGMQTSITQNWDLRGEYDYTRYGSNINSDAFKLGLVYKLD